MNYQLLKSEMDTDPLVRGYASMTDQQVADSLNTVDRQVNIETLSGGDIYECLDLAEFAALTPDDRTRVDRVLSLDSVKIQGNAKTELASIFGSITSTRAALLAKIKRSVSRAEEIGVGNVPPYDITSVRNV